MLDETESVVLEVLFMTAGYTIGGRQVGEIMERWLSGSRAVGQVELVLPQHDCTNPQRVSEKPRDPASGGFSGCSPLNTGGMNVMLCILWNGLRPVRTCDV